MRRGRPWGRCSSSRVQVARCKVQGAGCRVKQEMGEGRGKREDGSKDRRKLQGAGCKIEMDPPPRHRRTGDGSGERGEGEAQVAGRGNEKLETRIAKRTAITLASKHLKSCHAGLDPASSGFNGVPACMPLRVFAGITGIQLFCCRSNTFSDFRSFQL
jgi:hypothetical protein